MGHDDKKLTEDGLDSEPDETSFEPYRADLEALAKLGALFASDDSVPAPATPASTQPEMPLEAVSEPSDVGSTIGANDFFDKVPQRSTIRKAGRFLPNCFGSEFLRNPASADCGPCKFSESCKKTIVDEIPLLETARNARKAHFRITGRDKLPPADPKRIEFLRNILRGHHLAKFRKARKQKRTKDKAYQQERRANPAAETLIEKELQARLAALRYAVAWPGKNKYLQQLRGREEMIIAVWEAQQHARLVHGITASAAKVANAFNEMVGPDCLSTDQATTYQRHFKKLEQLPHAWKRFVKAPDGKIA